MLLNIDCHRHLGGSINVDFIWDTIQKFNLKHLAESREDVCRQMTFYPNEIRDFHRFLDKFRILDEITWNEELIDASIKSISADLESENVHYAWIDFSINKYMHIGWHKHEAIKFIYDSFERHRPGGVGLILSLKYESMRASQRQYSKLIEHPIAADCLIGIDLVGDESYFDYEFYKPIFEEWNEAGKITRAHVGESQSSDNVRKAIKGLNATNIAHGLKIFNDECLLKLALDAGVTFDMAITSNYLTGVWKDPQIHPSTAMIRAGLKVTIGSDDPVICSTTLENEFISAHAFGWSLEECNKARQTAVDNSTKFIRP